YVLTRVNKLQPPYADPVLPVIDKQKIRSIIGQAPQGYLPADWVFGLLQAAGIAVAKQATVQSKREALAQADAMGYPLVMKVSGPVHNSDIGGVVLGVQDIEQVAWEYDRLMALEGADGVLLQQQLSGMEVYMGAKAEEPFGHLVLCGLGGIFVEV